MTIDNKILSFGSKVYRFNRSITGTGTKKTLIEIKKLLPNLKIKNLKSGTKVYDWKIPPEWNVKEAFVKDKFGKKIIDFKNHNLHLLGYSKPVDKFLNKKQLLKKLYSLKKQKNAIPYVTSYYKKTWGFCVTHNQKNLILKRYKNKDKFFVKIDSNFNKNGQLNYGELTLPGKSPETILISTYICHPQMANNELSGPMVTTALAKSFKKNKNKKTLKFIFIPETIGSIAYIKKNIKNLKKKVIGGYVLTCIGDEKNYSFISTKYGNTNSDFAASESFKYNKCNFKSYSFLKRGSDERQFNSPKVNLPIASILRTKHGSYSEYHTSLDNFKIVTKQGLSGGYRVAKKAIDILNESEIPKCKKICEPFLQNKNLYENISKKDNYNYKNFSRLILDFLQFVDGKNNLLTISKLINLDIRKTKKIFSILKKKKIIF